MGKHDNKEYLVNKEWLMLVTLVLGAVLFLLSIFSAPSHEVDIANQTFAYKWIATYVSASSLVGRILASTIVLISAFTLYMLNRKHLFLKKETLYPCLFLILLLGISPYGYVLSPGIISMLLLLFAINNFISIQTGDNRVANASSTMFFISLASWFNESCLWFHIVFLFGIIIYNKLTIRVFTASVIGAVMPFLILAECCYITDTMPIFTNYFSNFMLDVFPRINETVEYITIYINLGIVLIISFLAYMGHSIHDNAEVRHTIFFLYLFEIIAIALYYIYPESAMHQGPIVFMITAVILSHYFTTNTGKMATILFYGTTANTFLLYLKYLFI